MRRYPALAIAAALLLTAAAAGATPPLFKQKKYYGPIPFNYLSLSVGFFDGADHSNFTDYLDSWAFQKGLGQDLWKSFGISPFVRLGYMRQVTPNHFLRTSASLAYLKAESTGNYIAELDSLIPLDINRTLRTFLLSLEVGFSYFFIEPDVRRFSPFVGGGFSAVFPFERLETESFADGRAIDNPGETKSENSLEAGLHGEFGMLYYISNRYSTAIEGRYQMSQSKFSHHGGNFDISYAGFTITLDFYYHF